MNTQIINLAVMFGCMQLARKVPFEDPDVLTMVRIGYVVSQVFSLAVFYYMSWKVKQKNDTAILKYTEPAGAFSADKEPTLVTTTNRDYDLAEINKLIKGIFTGVAMMAVMHGYMKFTQPLFMQGLMGVKSALENKPALVYIWGKKPEGDLKRPWRAANPFAALTGALDPAASSAAGDNATAKLEAKPETKKNI